MISTYTSQLPKFQPFRKKRKVEVLSTSPPPSVLASRYLSHSGMFKAEPPMHDALGGLRREHPAAAVQVAASGLGALRPSQTASPRGPRTLALVRKAPVRAQRDAASCQIHLLTSLRYGLISGAITAYDISKTSLAACSDGSQKPGGAVFLFNAIIKKKKKSICRNGI